jgi:hypothetical protein
MKVVAIHGIGNRFEGRETLASRWLPALNSGLYEAGFESIRAEDFGPVFYGSLFRPAGGRGASSGSLGEGEEWGYELAFSWYEEAARLAKKNRGNTDPLGEDPRIQSQEELKGGRARAPKTFQALLRQLSKSRFFRAIGPERALVADLREVWLFLHNPMVKEAVLRRCADQIGQDTRVVIGHSLGSVVGYEALCRHPAELRVDTFVTLGSPLGIQKLVFDVLTPRPKAGRGVWPQVRRWVNIADTGDIVALEKKLSPYFGAVEDQRVYNGWKSHDAIRYLTARETGRVVGEGLES